MFDFLKLIEVLRGCVLIKKNAETAEEDIEMKLLSFKRGGGGGSSEVTLKFRSFFLMKT